MSEYTKKPHINAHHDGTSLRITYQNKTYAVPKKIIEQYQVEDKHQKRKPKKATHSLKMTFEKLDQKFTKAGALLKGLRAREGLSQVEFAKKINVTQANLSHMENGRRPIGKIIAKRIEKVFGTHYRYFLE